MSAYGDNHQAKKSTERAQYRSLRWMAKTIKQVALDYKLTVNHLREIQSPIPECCLHVCVITSLWTDLLSEPVSPSQAVPGSQDTLL